MIFIRDIRVVDKIEIQKKYNIVDVENKPIVIVIDLLEYKANLIIFSNKLPQYFR